MMTDEELIKKQFIELALPKPKTILGIDFGQARDYTACVVLERRYQPAGDLYYREGYDESSWQDVRLFYELRHMERFPLKMPYREQIKRVLTIVDRIGGDIILAADATGAGRPLVEALHADLHEHSRAAGGVATWSVTPLYVQITGGNTVTRSPGGLVNCPKRDLIGAALILLQDRRLKIAEGLELRDTLIRELENFKVKINISTAHDSYEAWREGDHDDLVLALSLACWAPERFLEKNTRVEVKGYVVADGPVFTY